MTEQLRGYSEIPISEDGGNNTLELRPARILSGLVMYLFSNSSSALPAAAVYDAGRQKAGYGGQWFGLRRPKAAGQ